MTFEERFPDDKEITFDGDSNIEWKEEDITFAEKGIDDGIVFRDTSNEDISFRAKDKEVLKIDGNGKFWRDGKELTIDSDIGLALKDFLTSVGHDSDKWISKQKTKKFLDLFEYVEDSQTCSETMVMDKDTFFQKKKELRLE